MSLRLITLFLQWAGIRKEKDDWRSVNKLNIIWTSTVTRSRPGWKPLKLKVSWVTRKVSVPVWACWRFHFHVVSDVSSIYMYHKKCTSFVKVVFMVICDYYSLLCTALLISIWHQANKFNIYVHIISGCRCFHHGSGCWLQLETWQIIPPDMLFSSHICSSSKIRLYSTTVIHVNLIKVT